MIRVMCAALTLAALAGCVQTNPSSLGGSGTQPDPRDAALETGAVLAAPELITAQPLDSAQNGSIALQEALQSGGSVATASSTATLSPDDQLAAEAAAALGTVGATGTTGASLPTGNNPNISDEQDFSAVSNRQSIQSDAERIAAAASTRQQVQPTALPERTGAATTNIVAYALSNNHPVGTRLYSRTGINLQARSQRACAGYPSPDQAQIDFLSSGGPSRDRKGLDPDGDGYACAWDPAPFRAAVQG